MSKKHLDISPLQNFDIRLLRIFKAVVECKGFAAAEEVLGIGRSTISKYIADLEVRFGMRLCERGRAGFNITPDGQVVYQETLKLIDAIDQFRSNVLSAKNQLAGTIKLWLMDNTQLEQNNPLAHAIHQFKARPGNFVINLNSVDPEKVEEAVYNHQANIGITIANHKLPDLCYEVIGQETTSLYCSLDHPLASSINEELLDEALLSEFDLVTRGYFISELEKTENTEHSTSVAYHVEANLQLILSGSYVGILPDHIAKNWIERKKIVRVPITQCQRIKNIFVVYRKKAINNKLVLALLTDIKSSYAAQFSTTH